MELLQESSSLGAPATTSRNLSSSSSAFVSAVQSPFFSPRSPPFLGSSSNLSDPMGSDAQSSSNLLISLQNHGFPDVSRDPNSCPSSIDALKSSHGVSVTNSGKKWEEKTTRDLDSRLRAHDASLSTLSRKLESRQIHDLDSLHNGSLALSLSKFARNTELNHVSPLKDSPPSNSSHYSGSTSSGYVGSTEKRSAKSKKTGICSSSRTHESSSFIQTPLSLPSSARLRSCDVYIGTHGRRPSLLRFIKWLRAEFELQGITCFAADRARYSDSRSHVLAERVLNSATFGMVIITRKSFSNPYSIEELRHFMSRKNLVPIFFDLGPGDCLARDIIEKRGELWEKQGGELWMLYDGLEKEWKEAVEGLSRVDDWKLDAHTGNWRDCILSAVSLLAMRLGRRSVAERERERKERAEREEFPFPRNEDFVGRKKELLELELILFGDSGEECESDYIDIKARHKRKSLVIGKKKHVGHHDKGEGRETERRSSDRKKDREKPETSKGKEQVLWKESDQEIEMEKVEGSHRKGRPFKPKHKGRQMRGKRYVNILYGKGIACVSGESGIGKTELLLEFAYRFAQRYRMVLWVGGESRYLRQNYLNLSRLLGLDVSMETQIGPNKYKTKSFEEHEAEAVHRVKRELIRDIPFLLIIDNLERERDYWDGRDIMELLPRYGGATHVIISTRLPRILNLEPLKLSYLSSMEALSLMKGREREISTAELDALRVIEEKLGRLTLGLGLVGAILSELPTVSPTKLLEAINRLPVRDIVWGPKDDLTLGSHPFLMQLLEYCFSVLDQVDETKNLATRIIWVSGWLAPSPIPVSLLTLAAQKVRDKNPGIQLWNKCWSIVACNFMSSHVMRSGIEATAMLVRFGLAKICSKEDHIYVHELFKLYARKRGGLGAARAMVRGLTTAVIQANSRLAFSEHYDHLWAACFLVFTFGTDQVTIEPKLPELLSFMSRAASPLALQAFNQFSRCQAASELLRLCIAVLDAADESFASKVEKWLDKSCFWRRSITSGSEMNEHIWQEATLLKARILETRAKLLLKGGQYDIGEELCRTCINIRTVICGPDHPLTKEAQDTLAKLVRFHTNSERG
ncbi:hypothetical protein AMTRI_Chr07g80550 [Amborella trichopoda]|uniref:TIR domain-containing protein n=1 Tax=Amborella trichopoda TaxID=13333 RepID=W1NGN9_AMBTC|nr:uncharacterized protein LOC18422833 [Amborella trichopoda]ERM94962.1 hypothetical protein AMTR_s00009p00215160 [Amborella trichopoda]|eukprot:XP_006827546.1 uncharacterized protein LOC18422833 [Amborella trichopoda]